MKDSWRYYFQKVAAVCLVSCATAWSSAMCYAVQLAYDDATNAAYQIDDANNGNDGNSANNTNGWRAGDNGGFGFGPWDFSGTSLDLVYNAGPTQSIDDGLKTDTQTSSTFNDIGRAWTMYNPSGRPRGNANGATGTDIARSGRSFAPLQVGQTLSVVIDNPIEQFFYRGYNVKLNSGPGNVCYDGAACSPGQSPVNIWGVGTFEYFSYGAWGGTSLFDADTDAGVKIEFTLTGLNPTNYSFTMTPLDNPGIVFSKNGILTSSAPINWIEFQFYNTDSDFYPTKIPNAAATDYYIRSIEITGPAPPGVPGDYNGNGAVDAADYVLWRNGGALQNEVDTPGTVNAADYTEWRARFGNTQGSGNGISSAVPEPGTLVLLIAGSIGIVSLGCTRHQMN
jgi:hypothetical protein